MVSSNANRASELQRDACLSAIEAHSSYCQFRASATGLTENPTVAQSSLYNHGLEVYIILQAVESHLMESCKHTVNIPIPNIGSGRGFKASSTWVEHLYAFP
jgi:hypothetical protein